MKTNQLQKNISNGWQLIPVGDIFEFVKTYAFSRDNLNTEIISNNQVGSIHYGDIHSTYTGTTVDISKTKIPCIKDREFNPKKEELLKDGDLVMADASEDYEGVGVTVSIHGIGTNKVVGGLHTFVLRDEKSKTTEYYRQYIFRNKEIRNKLQKVANGVSVYGISKTALSKLLLPIPAIREQNRIVSVLETWDKNIEKLNKKIEIKKQIKKGLMKKLLTGKKRLSGFKDKWETKEIGELLDYEQPNKYIVNDTDYDDVHKTPVLTANKAFVLGYTNETEGIYKNHPVIIFDDFTMDNKFVDFDFKVKSSAIKILSPKNKDVNLKFVFERIQLINVIIGQHRRHYLSEYQYITMDTPNIKEQNAIAEILVTADKEITELENKLSIIKDQKKFLLNNLITGVIRTPENLSINIK
ncbi:restriction endonuclease subunit S [Patescibacteria group bacterium]|nr:restriction endonuclease subunit S [Patescibacteria group bacterium]MBU1991630.1 restriction endonuclease subunit S [Patescibacteria group bacterium]MBU2250495.1 restriction endonuclease subunit S [Patescibacteria group bacterium]